jgi:hypothetical protein
MDPALGSGPMSISRLRQMFDLVVVADDPTMIPEFYAPSLVMEPNRVIQGYAEFPGEPRAPRSNLDIIGPFHARLLTARSPGCVATTQVPSQALLARSS